MNRLFLGVFVVVGACGDDGGSATDAASAPDSALADGALAADAAGPDANVTMPMKLSETGLYADIATDVIASDVRFYQPEYVLWSDGATKRRWVYLPPGSQIDTLDMDYWTLPVGTKLWKEFTRDGVRVETRLLQKNGPNDWFMMPYQWNDEQTEAVAVADGVHDASGTPHDIPNTSDCNTCHGKIGDVALGFSAIQLSHNLSGLTLSDLRANGELTDNPPGGGYSVPGNADVEPALGYLHANCGGCHHARSPLMTVVPLQLRVSTAASNPSQTSAYLTAVCVAPTLNVGGATSLIEGGDASTSAVHLRMSLRTPQQMPPLGTEDVDTAGLAMVDKWINSLPACP